MQKVFIGLQKVSTDLVPILQKSIIFANGNQNLFIMSVIFYLGNPNKQGVAPIKLRVQYANPPINIKRGTGLFIAPRIWEKRGDAKYMDKFLNNEDIQFTLKCINEIRRKIDSTFKSGERFDNDVVADIVYSIVNSKELEEIERERMEKALAEERARKVTLHKFLEKYYADAESGVRLTVKGTRYAVGTLTSLRQARDHFFQFEEKQGREYDFDDIDLDFYREYTAYLNGRQMMINTIGKNINWLKTLLAIAEAEGHHCNHAFMDKRFKGAKVEVDTIYLTGKDLDAIRNVDLSGDTTGMELSRDIFMIGVWTAQRVSDYNNIRKEDIQNYTTRSIVDVPDKDNPGKTKAVVAEKNVTVLNIVQKKTGAKVAIPCSSELRSILAKYGYDIPSTYEQKINKDIKEIARMAKLDEAVRIDYIEGGIKKHKTVPKYSLIHTHTARRTGATLMYLSGMDIYDIMKITGHATPQTLKRYIKADELAVVDKIVDKYDYFD